MDIDVSVFPGAAGAAAKAREESQKRVALRERMLLSNTAYIEERPVSQYLGLVAADAIFEPAIFGSSIEVMEKVRSKALDALIEKAIDVEADAVLNVKFVYGSYQAQGSQWEVMMMTAYGTAVKLANSKTPVISNKVVNAAHQ